MGAGVFMAEHEKPSIVIFSSRELLPVANAVRENLRREFEVTPWTEGFFRSNELSLNTFLKQLLCFDGAVVLLGADDVQESTVAQGEKVRVPRDNVIFELGACMSRFGTQKTFFICPENPKVKLPSYFTGFYPLTYEERPDNYQAGTGAACHKISEQFGQMRRHAYASDLPSQGLAIGYFNNFLKPSYERLNRGEPLTTARVPWQKGAAWELNIVMPKDEFMNRGAVSQYFDDRNFVKCNLDLSDGRNINVYAQARSDPSQPLRIYDVPTTLITSEGIIDKIDNFWGGGGDLRFRGQLTRREIASFRRAIEEQIKKAQFKDKPDRFGEALVRILQVEEVDQDITRPL
jgi:Predicted nucleotide-binding protein containing TIR-like domain